MVLARSHATQEVVWSTCLKLGIVVKTGGQGRIKMELWVQQIVASVLALILQDSSDV